MNKKIGIVTVLYNSDDVLPDFFQSLALQKNCNYQLYVIDNSPHSCGADLCVVLAEKFGIYCQVVFNNANVGIAKGNNQGIKLALDDGCAYVLLSNNDLYFTDESVIANLMDAMGKNAAQAAVPKIYYYGENKKIWCAGGYISNWRAVSPHYGDHEEDVGQFDQEKMVQYSPTCFMLIDASVFEKTGLMDEDYFVYYDDVDFICRFNACGYKLVYMPKSSIDHKVSSSTGGGLSAFTLYNLYKNRILFIRKHVKFPINLMAYLYSFISLGRTATLVDTKRRSFLIKGFREGLSFKITPSV
jgi:GT2 family glycosyltransferase